MNDLPFSTLIVEVARWIGTPAAIALILERIPKFKQWNSPLKFWVVMALFVGLPYFGQVAVWATSQVPAEILAQVQKFVDFALLGLGWWSVSKLTHANDYVPTLYESAVAQKNPLTH